VFGQDERKLECKECGYIVYPPIPAECPKCSSPLDFPKDFITSQPSVDHAKEPGDGFASLVSNLHDKHRELQKKEKIVPQKPSFHPAQKKLLPTQADNLAISLKKQAHPDLVISQQIKKTTATTAISEMRISSSSLSETDSRIKIKTKKVYKINFNDATVDLGGEDEYLRFMGVVTENRTELFASNDRLKYFLDLAGNLQLIATSILSGELDRMMLTPSEGGGKEEICYFLAQKGFIYMIYGHFPDKKAAWLLNQMKINTQELLFQKDPDNLQKLETSNIAQIFEKRMKFILLEYIKLQAIFTPTQLGSIDDYLRVDYFGLSFQSIGVISSLVTNELNIQGMPPMAHIDNDSDNALLELKEALITAKVEAIAANTVGNTTMMPHWISVRLSFQKYRFILFAKSHNYYISLLTEGNLEYKDVIIARLQKILDEVTQTPFIGVLADFKEITPKVIESLQKTEKSA
jgi:hypothetical protein